ncbi:hypothetical protein HmCmsJML162_03933 [Escherichia coli]|nr:hypothetical protein HmCmsJML162_03933 [Escherichia coli]
MSKIYYALPVSGVLIIIYSLLNIIEPLKDKSSTTDATLHYLEKPHD